VGFAGCRQSDLVYVSIGGDLGDAAVAPFAEPAAVFGNGDDGVGSRIAVGQRKLLNPTVGAD